MAETKREILRLDENCAMAVFGPIAIVVWGGVCNLGGAMYTESIGDRAFANSRGKIGLLAVVEDSAEAPNADVRKASLRINERLVRRGAVGLATLIPGEGFRASVFRGVLTGMSLMSGHSYASKVFGTASSGAAWLNQRLAHAGAPAIDVAGLAVFIEELRDELRRHRATGPRRVVTGFEGAFGPRP